MTEHILSLSYGKDSLACLGAIEELGWPLDRIIHAEIWATDDLEAELPPMIEFKKKADEIIKNRWGITVEHFRANTTYEKMFYTKRNSGKRAGQIIGFPFVGKPECMKQLKYPVFRSFEKMDCVSYVGIASDEPNRFGQLSDKKKSPLVEAGWTEAKCMEWCLANDLLSPIYTHTTRGGCWFCHNQSIGQLRYLRKNYPELWALLLQWDNDSPVTFKSDKHTVHDYDKRFQLEDEGFVFPDEKFRWSMLEDGGVNYRLF